MTYFQSMFLYASLEKVTITTNPSNASVFIGNACIGTTPLVVELHNNEKYTILTSKEGHVPITTLLESSFSKLPLYIAMPGGALLFAIDAVRGNLKSFSRSRIHINLPRSPIRHALRQRADWKELLGKVA